MLNLLLLIALAAIGSLLSAAVIFVGWIAWSCALCWINERRMRRRERIVKRAIGVDS